MPLNLNPESGLIPENDLRAALGRHQIAAADFEAGVRRRIEVAELERANDPLARAPSLLRVAASVIPLPILTGGKVAGTTAAVGPNSILYKLISWLALPAISLLLMIGAAVLGVLGISRVQSSNTPVGMDYPVMQDEIRSWFREHKWSAIACYITVLGLAVYGATSLMLLLYLISLGAMLYLLVGFARLGLGSRDVIGRLVIAGLGLLAQLSSMGSIGRQDIHFVDQMLLPVVFCCGILALIPITFGGGPSSFPVSKLRLAAFVLIVLAVIGWFSKSTWQVITPAQIKYQVESINQAPDSFVSWEKWEILAAWTLESGLNPDLTAPRKLFESEISKSKNMRPNSFTLGTALRTGLVNADQLEPLVNFHAERLTLLQSVPQRIFPMTSLIQHDWAIRALEQQQKWSPPEKDLLEQRLLATIDELSENEFTVLAEALCATRLLDVIGRPINRDRYRERIHNWLREFHCTTGSGFEAAGGFKKYRRVNSCSLEETECAIELMQIYGIPDGLDLNSIRSYLRPTMYRFGDDKFIPYVALNRLKRLPGASFPTWLDYVYYERSLIMAVLLVALCIYATASSPVALPAANQDR